MPEIWKLDKFLLPADEPIELPRGEVFAIYDFAPMGDGILAFGDILNPGPSTALFHMSARGKKTVFYELAIDDPTVFNHATDNTMRFIASTGNTGFMLVLDGRPWIGKVELGVDGIVELKNFPEDLRVFPQIASDPIWKNAGRGLRQMSAFYEILQNSSMIAGIFSSGDDHLYALKKTAFDSKSGTEWTMTRLDKSDGSRISELHVPVSAAAAHLTVIPSNGLWTLIERHKIERFGDNGAPYMRTKSATSFPSSWFQKDGTAVSSDCRHVAPRELYL